MRRGSDVPSWTRAWVGFGRGKEDGKVAGYGASITSGGCETVGLAVVAEKRPDQPPTGGHLRPRRSAFEVAGYGHGRADYKGGSGRASRHHARVRSLSGEGLQAHTPGSSTLERERCFRVFEVVGCSGPICSGAFFAGGSPFAVDFGGLSGIVERRNGRVVGEMEREEPLHGFGMGVVPERLSASPRSLGDCRAREGLGFWVGARLAPRSGSTPSFVLRARFLRQAGGTGHGIELA